MTSLLDVRWDVLGMDDIVTFLNIGLRTFLDICGCPKLFGHLNNRLGLLVRNIKYLNTKPGPI